MNKMENKILRKIDVSRLLSLYLSGSIEKEDQKELDVWLQQNQANQLLLEELLQEKYRANRQKLIDRIDLENEWIRFQSKIQVRVIPFRQKLLNVARYAAVILLPLLLGAYLLFQNYNQEQSISQNFGKIEPGVKKAQLVLSNGEKIDLTDTDLKIEATEKNVVIENRNQSISYVSASGSSDLKSVPLVYNQLLIGRGEEYTLVLSDGTKVWLNSETKLKYPTQFANNIREVELDGEACFKVTKNAKAPFIVKTKQMNVEVLGTSFNVSAYEEEETIKTTLVEGSVKINPQMGMAHQTILKPNDQAIFSKSNNDLAVRVVNAKLYTSWTEGVFAFNEESLEEIMNKLARWYNIKVFYQDNEVRKSQFSGKLPRFDNCNELLEMIEKTTDVKFTIKENQSVVVSIK